MFAADLATERLVMPFSRTIDLGHYWLTRLHSRSETAGMAAFRAWLLAEAENEGFFAPSQ
jgi:LysR family transcriptional regulator of beta-lactamase